MSSTQDSVKNISVAYLKLWLWGSVFMIVLPPVGVLAYWCPIWLVVVAFILVFGFLTYLTLPKLQESGAMIGWAMMVALALGIFFANDNYNARMIDEATALGPIPIADVEKHPDVPAFYITEIRFGPAEGWYEVCGEDDCTEYSLVSIVPKAWKASETILYWAEIREGDDFKLTDVFERDTVGSDQEKGITRACRTKKFRCAAEPIILEPINPDREPFTWSKALAFLGGFLVVLWCFPVLFVYLRALFRFRKTRGTWTP